jgi:glycosyltransferase involved in cell wall biosynthesis
MPTADRREFIPRALRCFAAQTYPNLELLVVDNGAVPILELLPADPRIRYVGVFPERRIYHGQLMNVACEHAQGEFCIVWDDDDFYAPDRVFRQIAPLLVKYVETITVGTGLKNVVYYDKAAQKAWRYADPSGTWLGAIAFRKSAWEAKRFAELPHGADLQFQRDNSGKFIPVHGDAIACAIHATNAGSVGTKIAAAPKYFTPIDYQEVAAFTGGDL